MLTLVERERDVSTEPEYFSGFPYISKAQSESFPRFSMDIPSRRAEGRLNGYEISGSLPDPKGFGLVSDPAEAIVSLEGRVLKQYVRMFRELKLQGKSAGAQEPTEFYVEWGVGKSGNSMKSTHNVCCFEVPEQTDGLRNPAFQATKQVVEGWSDKQGGKITLESREMRANFLSTHNVLTAAVCEKGAGVLLVLVPLSGRYPRTHHRAIVFFNDLSLRLLAERELTTNGDKRVSPLTAGNLLFSNH